MRSNVQIMSSPKIDRYKPHMTSLIIEARVTSFKVLSFLGDNIFRTLERIEYSPHLIYNLETFIPEFLVPTVKGSGMVEGGGG